MRRYFWAFILLIFNTGIQAQTTFKAGWNTYNTGTITHEYTYSYTNKDSIHLFLADSLQMIASTDSSVIMTLSFPPREKSIYKTINYYNAKKLVTKTEEYKDDNMLSVKEWKYDDKNRKLSATEENKVSGNTSKKYYEYTTDKKNGDLVAEETDYFNGRVESYTKTYTDKRNVKYKEVKLNDNNKDVMHIETFIYDADGRLKERSVYFPEWKVTKTFPENQVTLLPKCSRILPVGIPDKVVLHLRVAYIKKVLTKNQFILADKECDHFEYTFRNFSNCEIVVATTNLNNGKKIIFRYKDKMQ